jgi:hypothetical protein
VKPRQPLCGLILSDTIFRIFESMGMSASAPFQRLRGVAVSFHSFDVGAGRISLQNLEAVRGNSIRQVRLGSA